MEAPGIGQPKVAQYHVGPPVLQKFQRITQRMSNRALPVDVISLQPKPNQRSVSWIVLDNQN